MEAVGIRKQTGFLTHSAASMWQIILEIVWRRWDWI